MGAAYSQWLKAREGSWSAAEISLERQLHELLLCAGPGPINHSSLMRDHSTGPAPEGMMAIERTARLASEQANTELRQRNSALLPLDEALPWCGATAHFTLCTRTAYTGRCQYVAESQRRQLERGRDQLGAPVA